MLFLSGVFMINKANLHVGNKCRASLCVLFMSGEAAYAALCWQPFPLRSSPTLLSRLKYFSPITLRVREASLIYCTGRAASPSSTPTCHKAAIIGRCS